MLVRAGASLETRDSNCQTALIRAASNNHNDVVNFLRTSDAKYAAVDKQGYTAVMYAKQKGYAEVERLLLEKNQLALL